MKIPVIGLMLLAGQVACASASAEGPAVQQTAPPPQAAPPPVAQPLPQKTVEEQYLVGQGDVLSVLVFADPTMSRDRLIVDPDGTIDVAEIGPIKVADKTPRRIQQMIEAEYIKRAILMKPNVTVTVSDYRSRSVWVTGPGVRKPGAVPLKGAMTLLEALAVVDYFNPDASNAIQVFKALPGQPKGVPAPTTGKPAYEVSKEELWAGRANHVLLQDGDHVYVGLAEQFYVSGQVNNVGSFPVRPGLTVWDAVMSIAGGTTQFAAKNRITVTRTVNGQPKELKVSEKDMRTMPVQPGDRIWVPRRRI